ncbi:uncharacterized protein LOC113280965 isoform X1 [Papaver somniferum]|uniref:uncharacterized protein LOC113280965 isoform X1 n=1 Tax=Papaver somniferum TaxID=3469 RepID=UPI000E6FB078|nr:uncharacterized protein LOC113280965 isoform X1 [Papaver somniferum]XP_026385364.1 uncharacterized protein LOC113280965 isoform X1 [Papaver somniferum]XP_026385365.1 uncharacterized protein LOC113280965 isoform X1 [Papaver somniferum]XP_026385366.1 uncharacterized protein LOC113280965 isoform X1 [Papaver somniferum]XP_026385367.1 uncharacterized protein LOC113280965 isoform X1 [Papaver somniferum]XP_026385368.1 uncharacterized protein LOC113280965 isoform X1 [Papaver somniferum]XP_02638536
MEDNNQSHQFRLQETEEQMEDSIRFQQILSQVYPRLLEVSWTVEDLLVRKAQVELLAMANHLTEIVIEKIRQVDIRIHLIEDVAQLRRLMNQALPEVVHAQEQLDWSVFLDRVNQVLTPLRFSPSNWTHMDPEEFLNQGREELECVSRMWPEATILVAEIAPMVETPALIRIPSDLWKFEMLFNTRLDPDHSYQRQFMTKFIPMLELNKAAIARRMEMPVFSGPSGIVSLAHCINNFSMKILVWNCRGAARPSLVRVMKNLIKRHKPTIVDLLETRVLASHAAGIVGRLGFAESIVIDPEGFSGGMCLLWDPEEVDIQDTKESRWAIHAVVTAKFKSPWILSSFYESTNKVTRKRIWDELGAIAEFGQTGHMVMGDLNKIGARNEKLVARNFQLISCRSSKMSWINVA